MARLGDICEILDSKRVPITASNRKAGIYPYYGANGIQDYVDDYIFDDELVLLAEDGGHFGSTEKPIAYRVSGKCWVNNHAHVLKPKNCLDVDYLCYSLMFRDVSNIVNGATRQKLTQADMKEIEIPLLSLEKQLVIVQKLNKVFELISLRKQQLSKLDELVKSRFVEMFGDPVKNSMGWLSRPMNDVCDGIGDGLHGTPEYDDNGDYPFINGNNLIGGKIVITPATKMVSEETYTKHLIDISSNAILISINGTLGKLAFYNGERVMLGKSACYCNLKPNINKVFVYGVMKSDAFAEFLDNSSTKSTIKNVGLKAMREFKLILPPVEQQERFAIFVEQIDKSKLEIQKSLEKLETLKKALMQKYFG